MWLDNWSEEKQKKVNEYWKSIEPIAKEKLNKFIKDFKPENSTKEIVQELHVLKQRIQTMKELQFV